MDRRSLLLLAGMTPLAAAFAPAPLYKAPTRPGPITNSVGMRLVRIQAGEFLRGSVGPERARVIWEINSKILPLERLASESPRRKVRITRAFYLGAHEVTQEQYFKVTGEKPSPFSPTGKFKDQVEGLNTARFPVDSVSHADAVRFCKLLTTREAEKGRRYRLPTEAEWEYACRAGTTAATHFGPALSSRQANFAGIHPHGGAAKGPFLYRTTTVGSYNPNSFGLHDMHGNVSEWCADWYGKDYYGRGETVDPAGPTQGTERVIRGGCWVNPGYCCRSANRFSFKPANRWPLTGFRVVCELR